MVNQYVDDKLIRGWVIRRWVINENLLGNERDDLRSFYAGNVVRNVKMKIEPIDVEVM